MPQGQTKTQFPSSAQPQVTKRRMCIFGDRCWWRTFHCPHDHPSGNHTMSMGNPEKFCRYGMACKRRMHCPFNHPTQVQPEFTTMERPKRPCKFGLACRWRTFKCPFHHPEEENGNHTKMGRPSRPENTLPVRGVSRGKFPVNVKWPPSHSKGASLQGYGMSGQRMLNMAFCGAPSCTNGRQRGATVGSRGKGKGKGKGGNRQEENAEEIGDDNYWKTLQKTKKQARDENKRPAKMKTAKVQIGGGVVSDWFFFQSD